VSFFVDGTCYTWHNILINDGDNDMTNTATTIRKNNINGVTITTIRIGNRFETIAYSSEGELSSSTAYDKWTAFCQHNAAVEAIS
jgi:hypothetical protein